MAFLSPNSVFSIMDESSNLDYCAWLTGDSIQVSMDNSYDFKKMVKISVVTLI